LALFKDSTAFGYTVFMSLASLHSGTPIKLSVIIPCFNEDMVIDALVARLVPICEHVSPENYEILLINDGSTDQTWPLICRHAAGSSHIVGIDLARNHGHQLALTAGLAQSRGDLVLVIDADLQDPPELLPEMLKKINEGYDVVYGQRTERLGETLFKRATAASFYRLLDKLIDIHIPQDSGDFRLMTRRVVDQLNGMPESYRFIRGMVSWVGFEQTGILYSRDPRFAGKSHYPLGRMLTLAFDGITGFSTVPLRLASHLGIAFGIAALAMLGWVLFTYFNHGTVTGWASTMAVVLVLGSAQLLILGVIGEYLGRMYMESKRRPLFIIREIRRFRPRVSKLSKDTTTAMRVENA
jgi:glycosyltransferase involved in cell wall biosynthesis